jgi:hypothetical protein
MQATPGKRLLLLHFFQVPQASKRVACTLKTRASMAMERSARFLIAHQGAIARRHPHSRINPECYKRTAP